MELQSRLDDIRRQGLGLAVISYDPPATLSAFSRQRSITFPLLSDEGSATIERYGILNHVPEENLGPNREDPAVQADVRTYVSVVGASARMVGIAFPGTFILDPDGRVTARFFEDFYIERNTVSSMLLRVGVGGAPVEASAIATAHADVTTYPSDSSVAVGNRITLAFDIVPHDGMHMYAPGADGYRVVSIQLDPQPFVRTLPIAYPPSETYYFAPLDERVPVYQAPFTLLQEVVVEGSLEAQAAFRGQQNLTLTGTLEYQACDATICYNPVSVPLAWTMELRARLAHRPPVGCAALTSGASPSASPYCPSTHSPSTSRRPGGAGPRCSGRPSPSPRRRASSSTSDTCPGRWPCHP